MPPRASKPVPTFLLSEIILALRLPAKVAADLPQGKFDGTPEWSLVGLKVKVFLA